MPSAEVCCVRRFLPGLIRLPFKAAFAAAVYGAAGSHETPDNRIAPLACGDKRGFAFWAFENLGLFFALARAAWAARALAVGQALGEVVWAGIRRKDQGFQLVPRTT